MRVDGEISVLPGTARPIIERLTSDLRLMAKTRIHTGPDFVAFDVSPARWWMGGLPMDMINEGRFQITADGTMLIYRLSMKRTLYLITALSVMAGVISFFSEMTLVRSLMTGGGSFAFLAFANWILAELRVEKYLNRVVTEASGRSVASI